MEILYQINKALYFMASLILVFSVMGILLAVTEGTNWELVVQGACIVFIFTGVINWWVNNGDNK